jgi:hypothetical protein
MNTVLVDALVKAVCALSPEERALFQQKLAVPPQSVLEAEQAILAQARATIQAERGSQPFRPPVDDIIHQMREERTEQLIGADLSHPNDFPVEPT